VAKYFFLMAGLRGAYCDGEGGIIRCETRRELKDEIQYAARSWGEAGYIGGNMRAVAWLAAKAWREAKILPYVIPLRPGHSKNYSYGILVSAATRKEYLAPESTDV